MDMKKIVNIAVPTSALVAVVFSVVAFTKTNAATTADPSPVAAVSALTAGQPVDLTYAAEKALPSVVYIKNTQNSKVQTQ